MPREGWVSVSMRKDIYEFLQRLVARYPSLGYGTITELVHDAVRHRLQEILAELKIDPRGTGVALADERRDSVPRRAGTS